MRSMTLDDETRGTGAPAPALLPGDPRRVRDVRLLGRLGQGGMGVVFLGESADGRRVCVKVIRAEYARDARFRARFAAEAAAARRVARFCTAQVLDAGTDGDLAYLVTEYIDGPTLTAAVDRDGPMHGSTVDGLAIGVAAALNGIHAAGIVHRDLKPSNVMLSRVGPKVIDFGIARALDALESFTESGHVVGTPAYMAPEQFRGATTTATDVFSWGAVVTFAATGRPPFGGGAPFEVMHRVVSEPPDLGRLERPLRDLVLRALDKDERRRPAARELLLALVGDADPHPVSRVLSTQWTPPPVDAATIADPAPTRVDDSGGAGPLLDRPVVDRPPGGSRRRRTLFAVTAAALVAAVATAVALSGQGPEDPGDARGGSPTVTTSGGRSTPSGVPSDGRSTPSTVEAGSDGAVPIALGSRVPPEGVVELGVGDTRRYRLRLDAPHDLYLTGHVCSDLVPWGLFRVEGGRKVVGDTLGCRKTGPYTLAAGEYELRVGGEGVDATYALTIADR